MGNFDRALKQSPTFFGLSFGVFRNGNRRRLCRQDSTRNEARRPAGGAADQVRTGRRCHPTFRSMLPPAYPPECELRPAARLRVLFREISAELSKLPRPLQKPPLPLLLFFCGRRRVSELIDLLACKVDGLRCGFRASPLHELRSCQPQLDKPTDGLGAVRFIGLPRCPSVHIFTQFGRKPDCRHWVSPSGRPASLFSHYVFA